MMILLAMVGVQHDVALLPPVRQDNLIRNELNTWMRVLDLQMQKEKASKYSECSTVKPPEWVKNLRYVKELCDYQPPLRLEYDFVSSFSRPWKYETTPVILKKDYKDIGNREIIVLVSQMDGKKMFGITKGMSHIEYPK